MCFCPLFYRRDSACARIHVMVYLALVLLGLCLGSFVNALVWRLRKQEELFASKAAGMAKKARALSIVHGRSMCMHCGHELSPRDLVPVFSWIMLRGKCRYCKAPIDDTPFAELFLPVLFVISYFAWPYAVGGWASAEIVLFGLWLLILTGFLALAIYDVKWFLLPDRIVVPVSVLALFFVVVLSKIQADSALLLWSLGGAAVISGLFFAIAYVSDGKWIGGGDVKLGALLGLLAGSPVMAFMLIFIASLLGSLIALPRLLLRKYTLNSVLPFGPFLLAAAFVIVLWGQQIYDWYFGLLV